MKNKERKGYMKQITHKLCQQIQANINSPHYIKEDNSSQTGEDIENSNMPLIQDNKDSIRIMFQDEINRGIAELKNELNKKLEQRDEYEMENKERFSNNDEEVGVKNGENSRNEISGQPTNVEDQDIEWSTFGCEFCDFKAGKKRKLNEHINSKHPNRERPFNCNYCDHKLKSRKEIRKHLQIEHGKGKYSCDKCGQSSVWKVNLRQHMAEKHNENQRDTQTKVRDRPKHQQQIQMRPEQYENQNRKKRYCHYWNKGFCEKGVFCQYAHESSPFCKYGKDCRTYRCGFFHKLSPELVARKNAQPISSISEKMVENNNLSENNLSEEGNTAINSGENS